MGYAGGVLMYLRRAIEETIEKVKKQFPILLLTGPRQIGKTTVLKEIMGEEYEFITMDDPIERRVFSEDPGLFLKNYPGKLLLDEIQYVPEGFPYLKRIVDESKENGRFLMTGSQTFSMMKSVSESLAGRVGILQLQGLSLREKNEVDFNEAFIPSNEYIKTREKNFVSYTDLWNVIHRGYMPRLVLNSDIDWEIYYSSYVQTYIERDVRQLTQVADENVFLRFMVALAARSGELLNYQSVAQDVGVSPETIKRWVSILESSRIIYLLQPYANNHLKRAIKTPKIYFMDTGLVAYLTRWPTAATLENGAVAGNIFETFVISEIIKTYLNVGKVNPPLYYYRDRDQKEIDLLIEDGDKLYPVEIKLSANPVKSMGRHFPVLKQISNKEVQPGVILCQYEKKLWLDDNLMVLPIEYV